MKVVETLRTPHCPARGHLRRVTPEASVSCFVLWARLVGPERSLELFGIKLVGVNADNGKKFLMSLALVAIIVGVSLLLRSVMNSSITRRGKRVAFWARHVVRLLLALV